MSQNRVSTIYVDPTVPVEHITLVYGSRVDELSQDQLIDAATAVKNDIQRYTDANEGVDSEAINERIAELSDTLSEVTLLLDATE
jgi:hypothetical protein